MLTALYANQSNDPTANAQHNLCGRTHYVDDDTLRGHKSRVVASRAIGKGLLFVLITSDALDMYNTRRGFRFVVFDVFGTVIERTELVAAFRTSDQASKAMWAYLDGVDEVALTMLGIERERALFASQLQHLTDTCKRLGEG